MWKLFKTSSFSRPYAAYQKSLSHPNHLPQLSFPSVFIKAVVVHTSYKCWHNFIHNVLLYISIYVCLEITHRVRQAPITKWMTSLLEMVDNVSWNLTTLEVLIFFSFFFFSIFPGINANFFVVLLQGCRIFSRLRELALLHTLTHIPMNEGTFSVHQIKFMI